MTSARCNNQRCINKSENAANRATEGINTGEQKKDSQRFVCRRSCHIGDGRGEERGDVAELFGANVFHNGGLQRHLMGAAKSSKKNFFFSAEILEDEPAGPGTLRLAR